MWRRRGACRVGLVIAAINLGAPVAGAAGRGSCSRCRPRSRSTATWPCRWMSPPLLGELLRELRASAGPLLVEARPFDVYRGPQVGEGVSYAIALRFQPEKAGDEKAVERAMSKLRVCCSTTWGPRSAERRSRAATCVPPRVTAFGGPRRPRPCGTPMSAGGRGGVHLATEAD